jgi:predicted patatin/cPLA2 family phospholipase
LARHARRLALPASRRHRAYIRRADSSDCSASATPLFRHGGKPALDGGIADNVPVAALGGTPGATLVLLSRRYRRLPTDASRVYVQPSMAVPVASWDYTNPAGLQAAYDLGRRDGESFARQAGA